MLTELLRVSCLLQRQFQKASESGCLGCNQHFGLGITRYLGEYRCETLHFLDDGVQYVIRFRGFLTLVWHFKLLSFIGWWCYKLLPEITYSGRGA